MKSLALVVSLFLLAPGSGRLMWDGLPLSTRTEAATLFLLVVALAIRPVRSQLQRHILGYSWSGIVKPILLGLTLVKVLTFTISPFAQGFEACYRSHFYPLENPGACEKSYEGPLLSRSDMGLSNTSRIEPTVDFGVNMYDWNLPFINEYPRLGALWLTRIPFNAKFGADITNSSSSSEFLPIISTGKISARIGQSTIDVENYEFEQLSILKVEPGTHKLFVDYEYRDIETREPPETEPVPRGPYASLKVGQLYNAKELGEFLKVRVRGWTFDEALKVVPTSVIVLTSSGRLLSEVSLVERPDVASHFGDPRLLKSGIDLTLDWNDLAGEPVDIFAKFGDQSRRIGLVSVDSSKPSLPARTEVMTATDALSQFTAFTVADRQEFEALSPKAPSHSLRGFQLLLLLVDAVAILIVVGLLAAIILSLVTDLLIALLLGVVSFTLLRLAFILPESLPGSYLSSPLLVMSVFAVLVLSRRESTSLVAFIPASVVVAREVSLSHLEQFHPGSPPNWWGHLLFHWRDSDWYATQGFARSIFVEGSLHGGESVFWFQPGPRFLAVASRILLGENDVLIGIIAVAFGLFASYFAISSLCRGKRGPLLLASATIILFLLQSFLTDPMIVSLGFLGSSEHPTWILMLMLLGLRFLRDLESRAWPFIVISLTLGFAAQLRPNQIVGLSLLLLFAMTRIDRRNLSQAVTRIVQMTLAFGFVVSLSLLHNLYYGESFVLFAANAEINYQFSWLEVLGFTEGPSSPSAVWEQLKFMMYWNPISNWNWALLFWGSQLLWLCVIFYRLRQGVLIRWRSLVLLIPLGYAIPMLKYQMFSYYPRHLVAINLSFMCAAILAWGRDDSQPNTSRNLGQRSLEEISISELSPA